MVVLGAAVLAGPEKREVVGVGMEAVLVAEEFVEGSKLHVRYLDGLAADFTHQVFVIVVQRYVPSSRLPVSQRDVVDQPDSGQIIEDPVHGRRFYPARALSYVTDDHPYADERLVSRRQGTSHGSSGKGQAQSGCSDPLYQQVFRESVFVLHTLATL